MDGFGEKPDHQTRIPDSGSVRVVFMAKNGVQPLVANHKTTRREF
jgi:hypothetical protein